MKKTIHILLVALSLCVSVESFSNELWRGLEVKDERRCSPYDKKKQYPYPASVEKVVVANMNGLVYGPYSGRYFKSDKETDIEHIVAASEGHDSGLCSASKEVRAAFAQDPLNLTLAAPKVNRCSKGGKCGFDAGEWMPEKNQCWFAARIVAIKSKYNISVDPTERDALEKVINKCTDFQMIYFPQTQPNFSLGAPSTATHVDAGTKKTNALNLYDDNGNGRITCKEARGHGIAPVTKSHAAYQYMTDRNRDGIVCD